MKKYLKLIVIGLAVTGLVTGCGCSKKEDNKKQEGTTDAPVVNTEENVIKDQTVEVFSLTNTSLVYVDNTSTLITEVTNSSAETAYIKSFNIIVKDASGKEMITLLGYIGEEIPAGETRTIVSNTDMDISKAASVEYTVNK